MLAHEKIFVGLCTLFALVIVLSNLVYQKFVVLNLPLIPPFELSAGAVLYPISFFISDLITEFYGKEKARLCVRSAITVSAIAVLLILFVDALPAAAWSKMTNSAFHNTFGMFGHIFIISMIACYVSQSLDIFLYLAIRKLTKGRYLWARNSGSTMLSLFIDTAIVLTLAAWVGIFPKELLWPLFINGYGWKLFFTIGGIPFFYVAVRFIRWLGNRLTPTQPTTMD